MHVSLHRRSVGFTLIELMVVIVILGLLAGLVGPRVMSALSRANTETARQQVERLRATLDMFRLDVGRYPTTQEGLAALVQRPSGMNRWNGPYLDKGNLPKDPWGRDYQYRSPGENGRPFDLFTLGADNAPGGDGENTDVTSWE